MNHTNVLLLAQSIVEEHAQIKQASTISRLWEQLAAKSAPYAAKLAPHADKAFTRIGQSTERITNPWIHKLLTGAAPVTNNAFAGYAGDATRELGKTVAKRVGAGAGIGLGGTLAAEAPFKAMNNSAYDQQQQHPLKSWFAQHLMGAPKLQHQSYLNPFAL